MLQTLVVVLLRNNLEWPCAMMLACEYENANIWALSIYISTYSTTIVGAYNLSIYNVGTL